MNIYRQKRSFYFATVLGVLATFVLWIPQLPVFYADPQYYIQSALLWPQGKLTFAASWLGSRDLVVLFYHLVFASIGPTLDSLSIALALVTLGISALIAVTVFSLASNMFVATAISLLSALTIGMVAVPDLPIMQSPASDNLGMLALALMWTLWSIGWQKAHARKLFLWLPLVAGTAAHIRGELPFFFFIGLLVAVPLLRGACRKLVITRTAIGALAFAGGVAIPSLFWSAWVEGPKPYAYRGAYAIFYVFNEYARGNNGPASASLATTLNLSPADPIPYWDALALTYSQNGPQESDSILARVGLEAAQQHKLALLQSGLANVAAVLFSSAEMTVAWQNWNDRKATAKNSLAAFDDYRVATSAQYGNDAFTRTEDLAERQIDAIEILRALLPPVRIDIVLPGYLILISLLCAVTLMPRMRVTQTVVFLPPILYAFFVLVLGAFTIGANPRYLAPSLFLNSIGLLLMLHIAWENLKSKRRHEG